MSKITGHIIPAVEQEYLNRYPQYGKDYIEICNYFQKKGADLIQVILEKSERELVKKLRIQLDCINLIIGGNISSREEAKIIIDEGADFVVLGKLLMINPELIEVFVDDLKEGLVCSVDNSGGHLICNKKIKTLDYLKLLVRKGVHNIVYVNDDTKLKGGVNIRMFREIRKITRNSNLIYSGGIQNLSDIRNLKEVGVDSVIVGTALYKNSLDFGKASLLLRS